MASFSNIATDSIRRLRNDETGEITLLFTRDGVPMDITGLEFSVGYNTAGAVNQVLRFDIGTTAVPRAGETASLYRPAGTTDRLVIDPVSADRAQLSADNYTIWVYLLTNDRRDPLVYYKLTYELEPTSYAEGQPREPAFCRINFVTATAFTAATPVYEVGGSAPGSVPGVASEAQANAQAIPLGAAALLLVVGDRPFIKIGAKLYGLVVTGDDI